MCKANVELNGYGQPGRDCLVLVSTNVAPGAPSLLRIVNVKESPTRLRQEIASGAKVLKNPGTDPTRGLACRPAVALECLMEQTVVTAVKSCWIGEEGKEKRKDKECFKNTPFCPQWGAGCKVVMVMD